MVNTNKKTPATSWPIPDINSIDTHNENKNTISKSKITNKIPTK